MSGTLGLDVSTSVLGICAYFADGIFLLDHLEFKQKGQDKLTLWNKTDMAKEKLAQFLKQLTEPLDRVVVEDPLMKFASGMSSMQTIATLLRFNALVSYSVRELTGMEPEYISAATARKACGMKLQPKKKCGMSHKEQVVSHMLQRDLCHIEWPKKKSGELVDWVGDVVDAYVTSKAGFLRK